MVRNLRSGLKGYRLLERWDAGRPGAALQFSDELAARGFVERMLFWPDNEVALMSTLDAWRGPFGPRDDRLVGEIVRRLRSGEIRVEEAPDEIDQGGAGVAKLVEARSEVMVKETSWVEFLVVNDATGDPVPDVKLEITLPKDRREVRTTPRSGSLEFDPCDPGSCAIGVDLAGATLGSTLELVGVGEPSLTPFAGVPFPNKDRIPRRIAHVTRHRVRTGESLESIAERAGMSARELARFNFGTESPKEIDKALRAQVGCLRRKDREGQVFDDSDDPGIVYVPRKVEQRGLATGLTHKLRVRPITRPGLPYLFSY